MSLTMFNLSWYDTYRSRCGQNWLKSAQEGSGRGGHNLGDTTNGFLTIKYASKFGHGRFQTSSEKKTFMGKLKKELIAEGAT